MTNAEKFIDYFNKIESELIKKECFLSSDSFGYKVKNSKNKVVQRFKDELITFSELRNAIVHTPRLEEKIIAEPHDKTVERIEFLFNEITKPEKVIPKFQFEVLSTREDDFINNILISMKEKSFSQFPVYNDGNDFVEVINTNTISRWLSTQLDEKGTVIVENIKVKDLIKEIEYRQNYKFISRNTSLYDAYDLFVEHINKKRRNLDVLLITENGNSKEKLLGLITIEDIAGLI